MKTMTKLLHEDTKNVSDMMIIYRLYLIRNKLGRCFVIKISSGNEFAACRFGNDRMKAVDIYYKVVRNKVTPCSLRDIAEDFAKETLEGICEI